MNSSETRTRVTDASTPGDGLPYKQASGNVYAAIVDGSITAERDSTRKVR